MALTFRTNGSTVPNLVTAAWWDDYYNLLTGAMSDQIVTIANFDTTSSAPYGNPSNLVVLNTGTGNTGAFIQFSSNNGAWNTKFGNVAGSYHHAGLDGSGNIEWGFNGTDLVVTGAGTFRGNGGHYAALLFSAGGGVSGRNIWVGTTDPGASAQEGDIWIKA